VDENNDWSDLRRDEAGDYVSGCAQLATLLEVSAYPKPGNVHRLKNFPSTRYEHFLAGSVAISPVIRELAMSGYDVGIGQKTWENVGVGSKILAAVEASTRWQSGGNVNLGVILLFTPISIAAGCALKDGPLDMKKIRDTVKILPKSTTPIDSINLYKAIRIAMSDRVLGRVEELDVGDDSSLERLNREAITLQGVFERCAGRDAVCKEWASGFETTFTKGYPYLFNALKSSGDINMAVVDTFLYLLSEEPDSLISRKKGRKAALDVSGKARAIVSAGGFGSKRGKEMTSALDRELQRSAGLMNPGTTADLTAASIFLLLLEGWRP
jgi:triphosphoribosyl-dephospho-CoA synthase